MVVADKDLFRTGLASLLSAKPDVNVVAQASGGHPGVHLASELRPDVVLMNLPVADRPEAIRAILARHPRTRVLVFTAAASDDDIVNAMQYGAAAPCRRTRRSTTSSLSCAPWPVGEFR
jgi:NarL family two-component system response regulator LiaR